MKLKLARQRMALRPTILLISMLAGTVASNASSITYDVNRTVGPGSVMGTIETDGTTTGSLAAVNILDWNLHLDNGLGDTYDLTGPASGNNSVVYVSGADVTATTTDLFFNFSGGDGGSFLFQTGLFSGNTYYCDGASSNFACLQGESVVPTSIFGSYQNVALSGNVIIGTVPGTNSVPEPETYGLTLAGFGLLVLMRNGFVFSRR